VASTKYIDVRKGQVIVGEGGQLFTVVDREHITPGNWRAVLKLKVKNLKTGSVTENRVKPDDRVEVAYLDRRQMQYLYAEGDGYVFMDNETYDQIHVPATAVGDAKDYLLENMTATVARHDGNVLYVELPVSVELTITYTEPGVQGDRSTGGNKPATLETGATVQVPLFITQGEKVKVDTRDGRYLGRVNA
jgi:elongation factor P